VILKYRDWTPKLDPSVFVADTARVIGNVEIGPRCGIWYGVVVRGDVHEIRIGAETNIQDGTVVHCTRGRWGTYIGKGVTIGHAAVLHGCTIEDGAFIGMQACVMDGAVVESGAMVAAGALVTPGKRVKAGELWAGSPAKMLRPVSPEEAADIPASAQRYANLAAEYLAAQ
jgi:carbonic anhydrase/acetyltransferase-like protein (isoleucine patch superfamily)